MSLLHNLLTEVLCVNEMLVLTHATERDIDLLLVEEFAASPLFISAILRSISLSELVVEHASVMHSVRRIHSRREIDISVRVQTNAGDVLLLIENKLDTSEQPRQAESYRAEAVEQAAGYHLVRTILVCPQEYRAANAVFAAGFDHAISYESLAKFFETRAARETGELGGRLAHRASMMRQAIEKQRRGYTQVVHPAKRQFTERYVALLRETAPELVPGPSMLRESAADSVTMIFAPETLPKWTFLPQMRIVHQLREANANINFYTWGDHFNELAAQISADLAGTGIRAIPTVNKRKSGRAGLMLVVPTPALDHFTPFDEQIESVRTGIVATRSLREWLISHQDAVRGWAALVPDKKLP
ncbi:PD-(D/E)XK nuclease superfamily [Puniceibacterium sp. IMCC21224]|nr:PD-(D/E)XK nuclease superfamily [Puniceibacterium sp. IMCC21224]